MPNDGEGASGGLSADEAFAVVGSEVRLGILRTLGEADEPLAYSELFDRIDYEDSANFTYHLDKLVGHFVRKTDEGYGPRLAGRRVVEAIYSGVVTDDPVVEPTDIDAACMYCGGPVEMAYYDEVVVVYCHECGGRIGERSPVEHWPIPEDDVVGYVSIPPAGVYGRTPTEIWEAAGIWTVSHVQGIVRGVCPRCAATIDRTVAVCGDHDGSGDFCDRCDHQFGVSVTVRCTNCIFESVSPCPTQLLGTIELLSFMTDHGVDPFVSDGFHLSACTEEIHATDPLDATYTFTADGEALALTVDGDLSVVDRRRHDAAEADG
jgi:hypothetical protein